MMQKRDEEGPRRQDFDEWTRQSRKLCIHTEQDLFRDRLPSRSVRLASPTWQASDPRIQGVKRVCEQAL